MPLVEADGVHEGDTMAEDDSGIDFGNSTDDDDNAALEFGFNPAGELVVAESGPVTVEVFDVTGRRVRTLVSGDLSAGRHELAWDGRDDAGRSVANGLYFYRARGTDGAVTRKVLMNRSRRTTLDSCFDQGPTSAWPGEVGP
jgi:flagellar hook assembly protein FlgD